MAFCSRCGAKLNESDAFCASCGMQIKAAPQPQAQAEYTYTPAPTPSTQPTISAVSALKKIAASPLFLVSAITFTLVIILNLIQSVTVPMSIAAILSKLHSMAYELGIFELSDALEEILWEFESALYYFGGRINAAAVFSSLVSMLPTILLALGIWLTFRAGASKQAGFKTGGLTLIQVLNMISLVLVCITWGMVALIMFFTVFAMAASGAAGIAIFVMMFLLLILAGVAILCIMYYTKINKTLKSIKSVARTGQPSIYASTFVGVLCFISAALNLPLALFTLGIIGKLIALCTCVYSICFGALIFVYRSKMRELSVPSAVYAKAPSFNETPAAQPAPAQTATAEAAEEVAPTEVPPQEPAPTTDDTDTPTENDTAE